MSQLVRYTETRERNRFSPPPQVIEITLGVAQVFDTGVSVAGASAQGTAVHVGMPVGRCVAGASAQGTATHVGMPVARSVAGALAQGIQSQIATLSGTSVAGSLARGTAAGVHAEPGTSVAGSLARGIESQIALLTATSAAGSLTYGTASQIVAVTPTGRCVAGSSAGGTAAPIVFIDGVCATCGWSEGTATIPFPPLDVAGACFAGSSVYGSTVTPPPENPMENADFLVGPLMNAILACLCEQSARAPNPPTICCFRVGVEIPHDAGINQDQCCEGIGYVALGDTYPSAVSFPEQDIVRQADAKCTFPTWAQVFKLGLIRCLPVGSVLNPISCDEWNEAAVQNVYDSATLRRVACCVRHYVNTAGGQMTGMSTVVERQVQSTPQGGCVERSMTVTVQIPNCDC